MKETKKLRCFSKLKRIVLTLFAAFCVGSVWADIALDIKDMAFTEDGTLSFQYQLGYSASSSVRYAYLEVEVIDSADTVKKSEVLISKEDKLQLKNNDVLDWATATIENIGYTSLEALYADSCALRISFKAFKDGQDFSNEVYESYLQPSGLTELEATYTVAVKEFIVYGKYDLNAGITGLDLSYALNDATLSNPTVQALTLNADGTFEYRIPYSTDTDVLYYSVLVRKGETSVVHRNPESAFKIYEQGIYEGSAIYTWTGAGDNIWANAANWTYEGESRLGYPGLVGSWGYYVSKVCFNTDAEVDLNGQTYYLWDNNRGFEMSEGITVKLKNGTLGFQPHNDGVRTTLNFGKANSTLILNNLTMPYSPSAATTWYSLKPVASSTVVVEGDKNYYWRFTPGNKNTKFKVMGGTVQTSYTSAAPGSGSQLEIENGVYIVKADAGSGLAATTTFLDGPDRQARLWLRNSSSGTTYYNLKLYGTYNIKIPETPYSNPYVLAKLLSANATCTMNIDVSDYKLGAQVPLIKFTGTLNDNTKNAMNTMTTTASKLVVTADGVDVKAARNAKLVWDETAKTLYFQQDSQNAASIGTTEYATLGEALDAATAGATIKVLNNVATDAAFVVTKKVTIDLNGKTIATTQADTEGCGVFWVKTGGELTLNGEGTINGVGGNIYNIAIWADGGKVTINGGTYTNVGAQDDGPDGAHFDLIYAKNGGSVEINGGTFKCQTPNWTLNSHDTAKGTIVVKGGTFYQFNPANCATEGAGTNFCADGLTAVLNEETGYYEIVDAWTAPMPEKDGDSAITEEYTPDVLAVLEAAVATSVDVKVNGVELKGNEAVKALNTAVASFDNALTFDGTAATLDIEIEVTEVNTEDPAASTVVVKRGTEELTVKATPTVKYFYPETKTWGSDKPESGAVLFKLVFEAPSAN